MMCEMSKNLARNLSYLRKIRGLSQDQLAQVAGLPRTTLSHIESGDANPSLKTLSKLAFALGVSYEELLLTTRPPCLLTKSDDLMRSVGSMDAALKIELLPKHIPGLQVQRLEFEAGGWHVGTPHTKGTRESFTTTLGKILISVEGEEFIVEKGDVLYFAGDSKHAYRNLQDGPSQGISIIALQLTHS